MRKKFLSATIVLAAILLFSQTFIGQQTPLPDNATGTLTHERIESDKAKNMISYFVGSANKRDHIFTKFNREELIAALTAMPEMDTVKFVIGAFTEDAPGRKKGKPVILLQLAEEEKTVPGGDMALLYKYMQGSVCPPPNGVCALEQ